MARGLLAFSVPAVGLAAAWGLLEEPARWWQVAVCAALGAAVLAVPGTRRRLAAAVLVLVAASCAVVQAPPRRAIAVLGDGLRRAAEVGSPFAPADEVALAALVLVALVALSLATALAIAARRPLAVAAIAVGGIGYPATLHARATLLLGVLAGTAALWPLVVLSARGRRPLAVGLAFAGAAVASSVAVAHAGFAPERASLAWQGWSPFGSAASSGAIRTIWDSNYSGITFPSKPTVVLRIHAPKRLLYWRASTLDVFTDDRWLESLRPIEIGAGRGLLPPDTLLPSVRGPLVRQHVTVEGYVDERLPAVAQPVAIDAPLRIFYLSGGVMFAPDGIGRRTKYTVWSHAPRPTPAELAAAGTEYPPAAARYLELGRTRFPAFGAAGADPDRAERFDPERHPELSDYLPLWQKARSLTRRSRSPYEATIAIENWLRATGGFGYTETPPQPPAGVPPLVDFATRAKLGYCQHYAGTMAVMLRSLGIPSRVAVGFTSGRWVDGEWVVTDHQAHAWVEAWFPGYGWLPFDPTPGRGTLSASYTVASDSADAVRALGTGRFLQPDGASGSPPTPGVGTEPATGGAREGRGYWPLQLGGSLLVLLGLLVAAPVVKLARRRRRLSVSDPRRLAAGVRSDLVDALRDHGVDVPPTASLPHLRNELLRLRVDARALEAAAIEARYGRLETAEAAAMVLPELLKQVRTSLRRRRGTLASVRAAYALRSLRRA